MIKNIVKRIKLLNNKNIRKNSNLTQDIASHYKKIIELVGEDVNRQGKHLYLKIKFRNPKDP
jgi:hypothetical protein